MRRTWTRRDFIRTTAAGAALVGCGSGAGPANDPDAWAPGGTARVVVVHTDTTIDAGTPPTVALLAAMLDRGIAELTGLADTAQAWASVVQPGDRVVSPYAGSILPNVAAIDVRSVTV